TAGSGIVHSERTPPELRAAGSRISGIQLWVGLPSVDEETAPGFVHVDAAELPVMQEKRMRVGVILGDWEGESSPVQTRSPMLYADAQIDAGARLTLPAEYAERGAYIVQGTVEHDGKAFKAGELLV